MSLAADIHQAGAEALGNCAGMLKGTVWIIFTGDHDRPEEWPDLPGAAEANRRAREVGTMDVWHRDQERADDFLVVVLRGPFGH